MTDIEAQIHYILSRYKSGQISKQIVKKLDMGQFKFTEEERREIRNLFDKDQSSVANASIDRIESLISEREEWILVEDKLPEFGQRVLVAYEPTSPLMERWSFTVTNRQDVPLGSIYSRMMDDNKFRIDGKVTHWQPLTSPAKTNEQ